MFLDYIMSRKRPFATWIFYVLSKSVRINQTRLSNVKNIEISS